MRESEKSAQKQTETRIALKIPFFDAAINAGFPSPALDYHENEITADELLDLNPTTFFGRVNGPSMEDADIPHGAILVVDRGKKPSSGHVVVAILNNEFTIKRLIKSPAGWVLHPANSAFTPRLVKEDDQFQIWGVVKRVVVNL